jgi:hypothetical protein
MTKSSKLPEQLVQTYQELQKNQDLIEQALNEARDQKNFNDKAVLPIHIVDQLDYVKQERYKLIF